MYQQGEDEFSFVWEWRTDGDEYEIRNNEVIFDRRVKGVRGLCMSKDFIITLQRDRRKDDTDESTVGRDASKCPHTVFLYDYDGNLVKIVDLGIPVMRIASEEQSNRNRLYSDYTTASREVLNLLYNRRRFFDS